MHLIFYYFFSLSRSFSSAFSCLLFSVLSLSVMLGGWVWWRLRRGPPTSNRSASTKLRFPNTAPPAANTTNAALHCARKPLPHKLEQNPWVTVFIFAKNFVLLVVLVGLIQLICRLAVKPSDAVSDWDLGGWVRVANFLEVSELGLMGLGCRSSGSFWVWVADLLEVFGGLVRWWCGGDAVMVAGCV